LENIFSRIDFAFCSVALLLFGVVLVVAFTNPVTVQQDVSPQRCMLSPNFSPLAQGGAFDGQAREAPVNFCDCSLLKCKCTNNTYVFDAGNVAFNSSAFFGTSIVIHGNLLVTSFIGFSSDVTIFGSLQLDAPVAIDGSLTVYGSISGEKIKN
jgi:hypothetical protein